jgi:Ca2+-binding RTX toxin-like protein
MSVMRAVRILVVVAGLLAVGAGPAAAATVEVHHGYSKGVHWDDSVRYHAAAGERNRPVITREGDSYLITDDVDLVPGAGCVAEAGGAVRCTPTPEKSSFVQVRLGDRDDRVRIADRAWSTLYGGPGNDRLVGSPDAPTTFIGGSGNDRMLGGHDWDGFLEGRAPNGADTIASLANGLAINGSAVIDTVDYRQRRHALHVTLDVGRDDGEASERDQIGPNVHGVDAGYGADVLVGGPGDDHLDGNEGRDVVKGKGGNDYLTGGSYRSGLKGIADRLYGGAGDDIFEGSNGPDLITGGPGEDSVMAGPGNDGVDSNDGEMDFVGCGEGKKDWVDKDNRDLLNPDCEMTRQLTPDGDAGRAHALLGLAHAVLAVVEDRRA